MQQSRPVEHCFLQDEISLTPEEIEAFTLTPQAHWPPVLYVNGGGETHEFMRQSAVLAGYPRGRRMRLGQEHHLSLTFAAREAAKDLAEALFAIDA